MCGVYVCQCVYTNVCVWLGGGGGGGGGGGKRDTIVTILNTHGTEIQTQYTADDPPFQQLPYLCQVLMFMAVWFSLVQCAQGVRGVIVVCELAHSQREGACEDTYGKTSATYLNTSLQCIMHEGNLVNGRGRDNARAEGECIICPKPLTRLPECTKARNTLQTGI